MYSKKDSVGEFHYFSVKFGGTVNFGYFCTENVTGCISSFRGDYLVSLSPQLTGSIKADLGKQADSIIDSINTTISTAENGINLPSEELYATTNDQYVRNAYDMSKEILK